MSRRGWLGLLLATLLSVTACSDGTKYLGSNAGGTESECAMPGAPPAGLALDPFYAKHTDARGIPVVSSASVSDLALERACDIAVHVLEKRADVHARLVENGLRVVVIARGEVMTDIPEYRDIYEVSPGLDWDEVARGVGPGADSPLASAGEENLLCLDDDLFGGEVLLIFSLGHGMRDLGILDVDPTFTRRIAAAYDSAVAARLWANTHAGKNPAQYWAEGVQDWFDGNREVSPEPDGLHNEVNTRAELKTYDPELAAIVAEYLPDDDWRPPCAAEP